MLLEQSFNFLVKTFKEKQEPVVKEERGLESAYKRKRLECCSDACRKEQLCEEIWNHQPYRAIIEDYMRLKSKPQSANLDQVAFTLREIKLGRRTVSDTDEVMQLCGEMFNAGYAEAMLKL
jgi:hypothetical protein